MSEVTIKSAFRYNLDLAQHLLLNRCLFSRNASDILKDANISEQVDHTWQLQRDWSLDYCEDEESKALIQQMLEEERYYAFGKKSTTIPIDQTVPVRENSEMCKEKLSGSRRVKWTDEEKQLFTQGMEIYGRSWTKVATLIPTKTLVQVRGYAARYNKMQEQISGPDKPSLDLLLETDRKNENKELQKDDKTDTGGSGNTTPKERKDRKKIKPVLNHLGNNCDLISKSDSSQISESKIRNEISTTTGHESVAEILRNANNERPRMVSILTHHHKMSNEETSDKNKTPNMISNCKGHKPFVHLLSEETSAITEDQPCIKSEADSEKSQETVHPNREPPRVGNEEVVRIQNMSSDDQTEDCDIDIDISDSEGQPESGNTEAKGKDLIYSALMQDAGLRMSSDEENDLEAAIKDNAMTNEDEPPNVNPVKTDSSSDEDSDDGPDPYLHENQYGVQNYKGEMEYMPNPTSELVLDKLNLVTEEEKEFHADYFSGNFPQRTPEAYMKIRNHILREWQKCKPEYLFKTTARNRLKNRGDVNRIGRIFSYLEQIGAINFGCTHCQYKRSKVQIRKKKKTKKYQAPVKLLQNYRKRKVRNIYGEWVDPKDLEGLTVEHREPRQKSAKFTKKQYLYNPFDLIPCPAFSDTKKAPFTVIIDNSALVLMDTHSHLSKTEVIGLLGGRFQEELSTLRIHNAEPCDSISTGMQCEMDPVSQTMAAEKIEASGNRIVGWYHSHPTFAPYPSVRDMETQLQFQKWFAKGGHEFIGMIVNPYRLISPQILSQITCLTVTEENKNDDRLGTPYRFEYKMDHTMWERDETLNKIQSLAEKYITFSSKVDMFSKTNERSNRAMTCLEKLLMALRCHIPAEEADTTCGQIEDIFVRIYSQYEVQQKEDVVD